MTAIHNPDRELLALLDRLCEEGLSRAESERLEALLSNGDAARRLYCDYIALHGTLYWDTAKTDETVAVPGRNDTPPAAMPPKVADRDRSPRRRWKIVAATSAVALALVSAALLAWGVLPSADINTVGAPDDPHGADTPRSNDQTDPRIVDGPLIHRPIELPDRRRDDPSLDRSPDDVPIVRDNGADAPRTDPDADIGVVAFIDQQLRAGWEAAGVTPSEAAADGEWLRRVYLDLVGHIPPAEEVERFLKDDNPRKRTLLVERLLDDPGYVYNWTTVWANLLVGRSMENEIDRGALEKFLRDSFAENRPWNEIVYEFVSAEGRSDENGAANFLLAHLNNEAVPATAITAQVFLGTQIQCTQCHDHPSNDWSQKRFWELNSIFQQTDVAQQQTTNPRTGQPTQRLELVSKELGGPTYYETRTGLMRAAFPAYQGTRIDAEPQTNRRRDFARLITQEDGRQLARALVNRMWQHFFGHGFTRPVSDMGPHNPPTHPELLDRLAEAFMASDYDLKQLIRWITASEAYRLSSRLGAGNEEDDPDAGYTPLFSRVYIKPMTAEQLYDSLAVATRADRVGQSSWEDVSRQRQEWLQQFVTDYQTDENDEAVDFGGTVSQSLMMMNGDLIERAVSPQTGTVLHEILAERSNETEKIRRLCLAALSREPTRSELAAVRRVIQERTQQTGDRRQALVTTLQDVFWAYLNSNEFALVP